MKKKIWIPLLCAALLIVLAALLWIFLPKAPSEDRPSPSEGEAETFLATVLQVNQFSLLVEPFEGEKERQSSSQISFGTENLNTADVRVGDVVQVSYEGGIMESFPAQIRATEWKVVTDLRTRAYEGIWLEKSEEMNWNQELFNHVKITRIYADCFFARPAIAAPYEIKFNGVLSEEWCVGDQIFCEYKNTYCDVEKGRAEADMISVGPSDWAPEPGVNYKPVIYLYPEEETEVSVNLTLDGALTCTYPFYGDGWRVTASPDGTLTDKAGQTYNYLYWEGETYAQYDFSQGFCVKGEDTAAFLESALETLGLTRREANEFIVYWLPLMEQNPYNVISFQTDRYVDAAKLEISPAPHTVIRVFMAWQRSDSFLSLPEQELSAPKRQGFTVVEWGGTCVCGNAAAQ